jgi:preprotein translocase subunit SecA
VVGRYAAADAHPEDWDLVGLNEALNRQFDFRAPADTLEDVGTQSALVEAVRQAAERHYRAREQEMGAEMFHRLERWIVLGLEWEGGGFRGINQLWREHLLNMDHLKEGIGLRGYGQRDPLVEYKKESFTLFSAMRDRVEEEIVRYLWRLMPKMGDGADGTVVPAPRPAPRKPSPMILNAPSAQASSPFGAIRGNSDRGVPAGAEPPRPARTGGDDTIRQVKRDEPKVGRNDPCPCGSGKKYKKCHGANA